MRLSTWGCVSETGVKSCDDTHELMTNLHFMSIQWTQNSDRSIRVQRFVRLTPLYIPQNHSRSVK